MAPNSQESDIPNRGAELGATAIAMVIMATVTMIARIYIRGFYMKAFGMDDWLMTGATIACIANITTCLLGVHYGTGRHIADLDPSDASKALMYWWACYPSYAVTMVLSKLSVGVFLLRVTPNRIHHWIIYVAMLLTTLCGLSFFFVTLFQCNPVSHFWNPYEEGRCLPLTAVIIVTCVYSSLAILTDFTFSILPCFIIWKLNMDRKTRIALIPILGMAFIASIAVCVRLGYINKFSEGDFLWNTLEIAIWSETEEGLAITAGNLVTLRPIFRCVLEHLGLASDRFSTGPSRGSEPKLFPSSHRKSTRPRRGPFSLTTWAAGEIDVQHEFVVERELRGEPRPGASSSDTDGPRRDSTYLAAVVPGNLRETKWKSHDRVNSSQEELHPKNPNETFYNAV